MTALTKARRWATARAPWVLPTIPADDGPGVNVGADTFTGRPLTWPLGKTHLLIAGITGSGKSVVLRGVLADAAARPDVAIAAVDLKAVELTPWAARLSGLAVDQETAKQLLTAVVDELRARRDVLLDHQAVTWDPAWGPYLLVVVDELAELISAVSSAKPAKDLANDCAAALETVARLGRALGVHLILATQRPDAETLGGQLRGQIDSVIGLRVRRPEESRIITAGVADLTQLGRFEAVYVRPLPHPVRTIRASFTAPDRVWGIAATTARLRPRLERLDALR